MNIFSPTFKEGEMIPVQYTCDGKNISPPLSWNEVPEGTETLALICDDPDAPVGHWDHWILFNIPVGGEGLPEGIPPDKILGNGAIHGRNSWGRLGYGGPCPPSGVHRYFFRLYALDEVLDLAVGSPAELLKKSMEGHILSRAECMGRYSRTGA